MALENKKIVLVLTDTESLGGISRFNNNLRASLANHSVTTLALNDRGSDTVKGFNKNKILFSLAIIAQLFKKPDLIIFGHLHFATFFSFTSFFKVKSIMILHGIEAWSIRNGLKKYLPKIHEYWAVSSFTQRKFIEQSKVEENTVLKIFNTLPHDWQQSGDNSFSKPYLLTVTRLAKEEGYKGVDTTISAIAELKDLFVEKKWTYEVVASGDDLSRHEQLVADLNLEAIVSFRTNVSDEDLQKLYAECGFFLLPSTGEGFGIVFLEAMAHAKAVVGAAGCGTDDVIENGKTGFLIEPSIETIKEKIEFLINHETERNELGQAGEKRLEEQFSFHKFSQTINELVEQCVG